MDSTENSNGWGGNDEKTDERVRGERKRGKRVKGERKREKRVKKGRQKL